MQQHNLYLTVRCKFPCLLSIPWISSTAVLYFKFKSHFELSEFTHEHSRSTLQKQIVGWDLTYSTGDSSNKS